MPVSGSARRSAALGGHWRAGWWLRRAGGAAQDEGEHPGHGCGREGSAALPLPRAAAVSTGLRVRQEWERAHNPVGGKLLGLPRLDQG